MNKNIATKDLRPKQNELAWLAERAREGLKSKKPYLVWMDSTGQEHWYEKMMAHTLLTGKPKFDRTGIDTISIHGYQSKFNLDQGFPLVTTKKVYLKSVIHELLWLIRGETNIKYLVENNVSIWSDWPLKHYNQNHVDPIKMLEFHELILGYPNFAKEWGELGPVYGKQWRDWSGYRLVPGDVVGHTDDDKVVMSEHCEQYSIDQIQQVINAINRQHETGVISRRMLVSAWNVGDLPAMLASGLPPCHCLFQFHSRLMTLEERLRYWAKKNEKNFSFVQDMTDDELDVAGAPVYELDLQVYQRSCDIFLGVPFNIASYALLLMMMAQVTNTKPGMFIYGPGDLHIYKNHLDQVVEQLSREPFPYPTMTLANRGQKIDEFTFEDFKLSDYQHHPAINGEVAV